MISMMNKNFMRISGCHAFSLVEVVVALGIFAIAVISVIGLLVPINQSIADVQDSDDASRVSQAIQAELQKALFTDVQGFISGNTILYASRTGDIVATDTDAKWDVDGAGGVTLEEHALKFFEIELEPNEILSPGGTTAAYNGGYLAFTIQMRWPGYSANGVKFNQREEQSLLVIPAAIVR